MNDSNNVSETASVNKKRRLMKLIADLCRACLKIFATNHKKQKNTE